MFWFLFAAGVTVSQAASQTEVVVVGLHVARIDADAAVEATDRMSQVADRVSGVRVVGPDEVRERLRGRGPRIVDEALQAHGHAMLAEGRVLFEHADLESAQKRIGEAVEALEHALAGATDSKALVDALLVQGNIGLSMGDLDLARAAFKRVIQLDSTRELDSVHYPPKVVALFGEVRTQVLAAPVGSIAIDFEDPDSTVHVDGRYRGEGTRMIRDMVPGSHHVLITTGGGRRSHTVVEVLPGEKAQISVTVDDYFIGRAGDNAAEWSRQAGHLYSAIGDQVTDGMILIAGETRSGEVAVQLYESRTGNFSEILFGESGVAEDGADPVKSIAELTKQIGTFLSDSGTLAPDKVSPTRLDIDISTNPVLASVLYGSGAPPPLGVPAAPAPATAESTERDGVSWYVWAGVGVMLAGATGVALALRPDSTSQGKGGSTASETGTVVVRF